MANFDSENKITYEELAPTLQDKLKNTVTSDDLVDITTKIENIANNLNDLLSSYIKKNELYEAMHRYESVPENYVPADTSDNGWNGISNKSQGFYISTYTSDGKITNQPTNKGQLINIPASKANKYSTQLWIDQNTGNVYTRVSTGNINGTKFTRLLNEKDITCPYKVGDIMISLKHDNPSIQFPNTTWRRINDRFLLAASETMFANKEDVDKKFSNYQGGEEKVTLKKEEIPAHNHTGTTDDGNAYHRHQGADEAATMRFDAGSASAKQGNYGLPINICCGDNPAYDGRVRNVFTDYQNATHAHKFTTDYTGGGQAHNNMPPYLKVYMWYRVS